MTICKKVGGHTVLKKPHIMGMVIHRLQHTEEVENMHPGQNIAVTIEQIKQLKNPITFTSFN